MRNGVSWVRFPLRGFDFFWHLTGIWELASLKMSNNNLLYLFQVSYGCLTYCVVIENLHTPVEGIGNSWGRRGSQRQKKLKKCLKLNWNSQRGGGGWGCLRRKSFRGVGTDIFWNYTLGILPQGEIDEVGTAATSSQTQMLNDWCVTLHLYWRPKPHLSANPFSTELRILNFPQQFFCGIATFLTEETKNKLQN